MVVVLLIITMTSFYDYKIINNYLFMMADVLERLLVS